MAPLVDGERHSAYLDAIRNGHCNGYVDFDISETAHRWIQNNLGITVHGLRLQICQHVIDGGEIDEIKERREEWSDYEFHYDLRFKIDGVSVYVETRLLARFPFTPDQPSILVVNVHAP